MPGPSAPNPSYHGSKCRRTAGRAVAELARRQHGIVGRVNCSRSAFPGRDRSWGDAGRLHRIHRGVYAVGHTAITIAGAVDGGGARLGRGSGAQPSVGDGALGDLGIRGGGGARHGARKVRSHGSIRRHFGLLPGDEVTVWDGIPVTSAARAVLDLAADKGEAAAETGAAGDGIPRDLRAALLARRSSIATRGTEGTPIVAVCLERLRDDPGGRVRSPLEEVFLPFLDEHQIPRPRLNAWLTVDDAATRSIASGPRRGSSASWTASSRTGRSEPSAETASATAASAWRATTSLASRKTSSATNPSGARPRTCASSSPHTYSFCD